MTSKPSVVIAFAYGASDWKTSGLAATFRDNLPGIDVEFEPVDWRPYLPSPQAHLMRFVRNRDAEAPCDDDARPRRRSGRASLEPEPARRAGRAANASTDRFPARADLAETAAERAAVRNRRQTGRLSLDPLARPAMRVVHHAILDSSGITFADVLGYLRDPDAVIGPVSERIREVRRGAGDRPVVAVGLSLGGIILVDTLASMLNLPSNGAPAPVDVPAPADLLVTVGSQSAALRAMGVMPSAPRDVIHPRFFTPWLNVWHEHDYLSFPVGAMFEHLDDVCDRRAMQRGSFPGVHSGYLTKSSRFFDHLGEAIRDRFGEG